MVKEVSLKQVPLFADLPAEELKRCASFAQERTYRKGGTIFYADDPSNVLFILKAGTVKIALQNQAGKETILKMLDPPDFFGEMSLLDGQFHSATITALEKTHALVLKREAFIRLICQYPDFALKIMKALSSRLRETNRRIAFSDAYGKVAQAILALARERGEKVPGGVMVPLKLTRQELADYTMVSRMTLHRVLSEFEKARCILLGRARITILNEALLARG